VKLEDSSETSAIESIVSIISTNVESKIVPLIDPKSIEEQKTEPEA
jgi:hypothetical protein